RLLPAPADRRIGAELDHRPLERRRDRRIPVSRPWLLCGNGSPRAGRGAGMIRRPDTKVQMIRVDQIDVVNGRTRGKAKFKQIVDNISRIGLKKPITVARRETRSGETRYDLVCGEGRLNAYKALGQEVVPAIVVEASKEDLLLMSLVENLARKRHTGLELAK